MRTKVCLKIRLVEFCNVTCKSLFDISWIDGNRVGQPHSDVLDAHVRCQELLQVVNAGLWQAIERETHVASVRIQPILQTAEGRRIVAHTLKSLFNLKKKIVIDKYKVKESSALKQMWREKKWKGDFLELWIEKSRRVIRYEERNRGRIHQKMVAECIRKMKARETKPSKWEMRRKAILPKMKVDHKRIVEQSVKSRITKRQKQVQEQEQSEDTSQYLRNVRCR